MSDYSVYNLVTDFKKRFGLEPLLIEAPGRINLIGEHTDYNEGFVLPAAIDKSVKLAIQKSKSTKCTIVAMDLDDEYTFSINDKLYSIDRQWVNYLIGVVAGILDRKKDLNGFNVMFTSNIPIGAGLSSSAAIECAMGFALDQLFELKIPLKEIARIGQQAEHMFAGVKCGIMDQYASVFGEEDSLIQIDCRTEDHEMVNGNFAGYSVLLCDTNIKHSLASSEYNKRRNECEEGVAALQQIDQHINSLRDATLSALSKVQDKISPTVFRRCEYVIEENVRVEQAVVAIEHQDVSRLGKLMYASHDGLKNQYEVSCEELDLLVDLAKADNNVIGARMMGGGFGGCTINLVKKDGVEGLKKHVSRQYSTKTGREVTFYDVKISAGVRRISV